MKRLFPLVCAALLLCGGAHAQNYFTVSGTSLQDLAGNKLARGTISFQPVNNYGQPISFTPAGGGQAMKAAVTAPVTNGAFSLQVANTTVTVPQNVCYKVTAQDASGATVLDVGYKCVQTSGVGRDGSTPWCNTDTSTCNFDQYQPNMASLAVVQTGPAGPIGPQGPQGPAGTGFSSTPAQCPTNEVATGIQATGDANCTAWAGGIQQVNASGNLSSTPGYYYWSTCTGPCTQTLPSSVPSAYWNAVVANAGTSTLTVASGSANIYLLSSPASPVSSLTLAVGQDIYLTTDGTNYYAGSTSSGGSASWGAIGGTLSSQADLQAALNAKANTSSLATVATSGSYLDLLNQPTIPAAQVNSDWNAVSGVAQILNKPTIPAAQVNSDWNAVSGVAQILNKPTIPAAQVNSDWNAVSGVAQILNKPTLGTAAAQNTSAFDAAGAATALLNTANTWPLQQTIANVNDQMLLYGRTGVAHFGDSISTAACGGGVTPSSNCYIPYMDTHYNWTATNYSNVGYTLSQESATQIVNYATGQTSLSTVLLGQNDAPNGNLATLAAYQTYAGEALAAHLSLLIPNTSTNRTRATSCTRGGSGGSHWTTSGVLYTNGEITSTVGDTASCTFFGNVGYFVFSPTYNAPVVITIAIDGGAAVTYTITKSYTISPNTKAPFALRIPVPANINGQVQAYGLHTAVITTTTTSGNSLELDWVAGNANQFNGQGPIDVIFTPYMANGSDMSYSQVITILRQVAADLFKDGLGAALVDFNSACGNQGNEHLCNQGPAGVHPDNAGAAIMDAAAVNQLSAFIQMASNQAARVDYANGTQGTTGTYFPQPLQLNNINLNGSNNNFPYSNAAGFVGLSYSYGTAPYTVTPSAYISRNLNSTSDVLFTQVGTSSSLPGTHWDFLAYCDNGSVAFTGTCTNYSGLQILATSATAMKITGLHGGTGAAAALSINPEGNLFLGAGGTNSVLVTSNSFVPNANGTIYLGTSSSVWRIVNTLAIASGTASNSDLDGQIAISASTTGTYTFAGSYTSAPICTVTPTSDPTSTGVYWVTTSTTTLTVTIKTSGTITFNYVCHGRN